MAVASSRATGKTLVLASASPGRPIPLPSSVPATASTTPLKYPTLTSPWPRAVRQSAEPPSPATSAFPTSPSPIPSREPPPPAPTPIPSQSPTISIFRTPTSSSTTSPWSRPFRAIPAHHLVRRRQRYSSHGHLSRLQSADHPPQWLSQDLLRTVTTNCNPPVNSRRPNQFFQRAVAGDKSNGASNYNSLQVKLERRVSNGFTLLTAYTWSKCISGPSDVGGQIGGGNFIGAPQSLYFLNLERSVCGFDVPQRFVTTVLYDIPFFKKSRPLLRYPLAGWQVSTIVTAQSGFPGNVTNNIDTTSTAINSRPDQIANGFFPTVSARRSTGSTRPLLSPLSQRHSATHLAPAPSVCLASSMTTSPLPKASSSRSPPTSVPLRLLQSLQALQRRSQHRRQCSQLQDLRHNRRRSQRRICHPNHPVRR